MTESDKIESIKERLCKMICEELIIEKADSAPTHIYNSGDCEFYSFSSPTLQSFNGIIIEDPPFICFNKETGEVSIVGK